MSATHHVRVRLWPRESKSYDVLDDRGKVLGSVWDYGARGWCAFNTDHRMLDGFFTTPEDAAHVVAPLADEVWRA